MMTADGILKAEGNTSARRYELNATKVEVRYALAGEQEEHIIWREQVAPLLDGLPDNVLGMCHYGFTEMVNNAIDHSEGSELAVTVVRSSMFVEIWIVDDGVGIFHKIRKAFGLRGDKDAVLELSKGKLTTDPKRHSGEGIFFTSRMCDSFGILSGKLFFGHFLDGSDWLLERISKSKGTTVEMTIDVATKRTLGEVFDRFAVPDEYAFDVTHVPVALARHGDENLVSRSQAKRLVRGFDQFKKVFLDFSGVRSIGQAFADEVFRVFQIDHPDVQLMYTAAAPEVERMILRARAKLRETQASAD